MHHHRQTRRAHGAEPHGKQRRGAPPPRLSGHAKMVGPQPREQPIVGGKPTHDLHPLIRDRPRLVRPGKDEPTHLGKESPRFRDQCGKQRREPSAPPRVLAKDGEREFHDTPGRRPA